MTDTLMSDGDIAPTWDCELMSVATQDHDVEVVPGEELDCQSEMDIRSETDFEGEEEGIAREEEYLQIISGKRTRWLGWVS